MIFLYLKPLNYKLMLPHKSYSLTPNITSYNVLITNFLEVSGTFEEKNIYLAWKRRKGRNLKLLSLWSTLSVRNLGVGGGFGKRIFPLLLQRLELSTSSKNCKSRCFQTFIASKISTCWINSAKQKTSLRWTQSSHFIYLLWKWTC